MIPPTSNEMPNENPRSSAGQEMVGAVSKSVRPSTGISRLSGGEASSTGGIDWGRLFPFTHLFRTFRLAMHPGKIGLMLLSILLIYTAGRVFDFAWGPQVYSGEVEAFQAARSDSSSFRAGDDAFKAMRARRIESREATLDALLSVGGASISLQEADELKHNPRAAYRTLKAAYRADFFKQLDDIHETRLHADEALKSGGTMLGERSPAEVENMSRAAAAARLLDRVTTAKEAIGTGIFDAFLAYEMRQFDGVIENTLGLLRIAPVHRSMPGMGGGSSMNVVSGTAIVPALATTDSARWWDSDTVTGCAANMIVTGPGWLVSATAPMQWQPAGQAGTWMGFIKICVYRGVYLFTLFILLVFSILLLLFAGTTASRLSAVEIAGLEEEVGIGHAMKFARKNLFTLVKAFLTPIGILAVVAAIIGFIGLLGAIPIFGEVLIGVGFVVMLVVGFIGMLLALGLLGGSSLLVPAVSVEQCDAFDAVSRAFGYVFARPWRLLGYTVTLLVYGAVTYVFVSFAVFLLLTLTHIFCGWGMNVGAAGGTVHAWYAGVPKLEGIWPMPRFEGLIGPVNWYAMSWPEYIGSLLLHFWVYLTATAVGAYVLSFYFSGHTVMYLLLRRWADGQTMGEIALSGND